MSRCTEEREEPALRLRHTGRKPVEYLRKARIASQTWQSLPGQLKEFGFCCSWRILKTGMVSAAYKVKESLFENMVVGGSRSRETRQKAIGAATTAGEGS